MTTALVKQNTVDIVAKKVRLFQENNELHLPADYSPENAMKSAWLILQSTQDKDKKPALQVCTTDSIANSLLDMVVQGLNPAKKQCYFIVYGNKLVCQRSYFGSMAVAKNVAGAKDVYAQVVYKGDDFVYGINRGRKQVLKHEQKLENVKPENILAAYCVIEFGDERPPYTDIMTMDQIKTAWSKSKMNPDGKDSTHSQFSEEMAKKTVINRACKAYINSSSDGNLLLIKHFNRTEDALAEQEVEEEIAENANGDYIDIEATITEVEPENDPAENEQKQAENVDKSTQNNAKTQKSENGQQETIGGGPGW